MSGEMRVLLCFRDQMENFKLIQNHVSVSLALSRAHRMHSAAIKGHRGRYKMSWNGKWCDSGIWGGVLSQSINDTYLRLHRKEAKYNYLLLQQDPLTIWGAWQFWEVLIFHPFVESIIYTCLVTVILSETRSMLIYHKNRAISSLR